MPVHHDVVKRVLPKLVRERSAHLYLAMYERSRRYSSQRFAANLTDLSRLIDCDPRTARECIIELCRGKFVEMVHKGGRKRSRTDKPIFRVPASDFDLESGNWFPVPKFLVTEYIPKFAGSLLLVILLYFQHLKWQPYCWVGVSGLQQKIKWATRTIYDALNRLGHRKKWERLNTDLPWPLEISYSPDRTKRRFTVRAVKYYRPKGRKTNVVALTKEFAEWYRTRARRTHGDADDLGA